MQTTPKDISQVIADSVYSVERLSRVQVQLYGEPPTITRIDFKVLCDKETLEQIAQELTARGLTVATSPGTHDHLIYVDIVP